MKTQKPTEERHRGKGTKNVKAEDPPKWYHPKRG